MRLPFRPTPLAVLLLLSLFSSGTDAAMISVTDEFGNSNISIVEGTATTDIYVRIAHESMIDTTDQIEAAQFVLKVGDGGPTNPDGAGTDIVPITAFNPLPAGAGSNAAVFQPAAGHLFPVNSFLPPPNNSLVDVDFSINTLSPGAPTTVTIFEDGSGMASVLGVFTLDTSGLTAGNSFQLMADITSGFTTITSPGGPLSLNFTTGTLTATAVPEPGSMIVLALGTAVAGGRRLRRRYARRNQDSVRDV